MVLGRLREFVEVPEYKSLRCMKKRHCLSAASLAFFHTSLAKEYTRGTSEFSN